MRHSEINIRLREARRFPVANHFHLPPFAAWTPGDWRVGHAHTRTRANQQ
jgi:D-lyxose ketol-isomerase